ncbi:hypothetical protein IFM89_000284 [Coptis chinensis]|uniref:Uncharacterized protein n=1 Tax=Coptis chinensis TaxID=261450 RepID=A0A835H8Q7_9MAGN|nr:hypothetical protein IFM89_000284 [Coptis chinensis]
MFSALNKELFGGLKATVSLGQDMFEEKRSILEPTGVLVIVGAKVYCKYYSLKNETVVAITSGVNMNFSKLKLVAELADIGRQREDVLSTCMTKEPGSFKRVGLHTVSELTTLVNRMEYSQLETESYTSNGLV